MKSPRTPINSWLASGVAVASFLLPALSLSVPSGYSWGALLLCLCGLGVVLASPRRVHLQGALAAFAIPVTLMGLLYTTDAFTATGFDVQRLDRPAKFVLALLSMAAVAATVTDARNLRWGIWVGALGSGATAAYEVMWLELPRADGYTNAIQFGDIGLLLGLWSAVWAYQTTGRWRWWGWLACGAGIYAGIASEARGGWVVLPVLCALAWWFHLQIRPSAQPKARPPERGLLLVGALALLIWQAPLIQHKGLKAWKEAEQYLHNTRAPEAAFTSVGQRLAHWQFAWEMGAEKPLWGWSDDGYKREKSRRAASGEAPAVLNEFGHAHNDWLELWAKRGLFGIVGLALLLWVPARAYWRVLRSSQNGEGAAEAPAQKAAALCGLLLTVGYFGFGQTQVMFAHNSGVMVYLFMNVLFLSLAHPVPRAGATTTHAQ